ncbi:MAG: hypothetical protein IJC61_05330 [Oscillospiraceae bacterium]|nr:hypothetical protein [Oscillospiraceae bacterium]MBQ9958827.1 hypothetical protein [Oscillospiraceae bacterium]
MKTRKLLCLLLAAALCLCLCGCGEKDPLAGLTQYHHSCGVSIKMAKGYSENNVDGLNIFDGENSAVRMERETFETLATVGYDGAAMSESDYAELIIAAYGLDGSPATDEYGSTYLLYTMPVSGADVNYYAFYYKTADSFWTVTFMCVASEAEQFESDYHLWASTVEIG